MSIDAKTKLAITLEDAAKAIRNYDIEAKYKATVEPVENTIKEHPIPSVLVGAGVGILIGVLIAKHHNRY